MNICVCLQAKEKTSKDRENRRNKKGQLNKCGKAGDGEIRSNKCEEKEQKMEREHIIF